MKIPVAVLVLLPVFALASSSTESANPESFTPAETLATFPLPDKIVDSGPCVDLHPDEYVSEPCRDLFRRCGELIAEDPTVVCSDPELRDICQLSCGVCGQPSSTDSPASSTEPTTPGSLSTDYTTTETSPAPFCEDYSQRCVAIVATYPGICENHTVREHCKHSCNNCDDDTTPRTTDWGVGTQPTATPEY